MASEVLILWREGAVTCEWAVGSHDLQVMEGEELLLTQPLSTPEDILDHSNELRFFYLLGREADMVLPPPVCRSTVH
jgi:hypothetical protein